MSARLSFALCSTFVVLLASVPAAAQSTRDTLVIHVPDSSGAPLAAAVVTLAARGDRAGFMVTL